MKYIVSESQLKVLLKEDRVTFLRTNNVITKEQLKDYKKSEKEATTERPEVVWKKELKLNQFKDMMG